MLSEFTDAVKHKTSLSFVSGVWREGEREGEREREREREGWGGGGGIHKMEGKQKSRINKTLRTMFPSQRRKGSVTLILQWTEQIQN